MQLGGGQGSHSPSPSNQENNKSTDKKKDAGKDKGKQQSNRMGSFKPFKKQVIVKNGKKVQNTVYHMKKHLFRLLLYIN